MSQNVTSQNVAESQRADTTPPVGEGSVGSRPPLAEEGPQRTADGRFAPGNLGGPGNPHARRSAQIQRLFQSTATDEDILEIAREMREAAKKGDRQAAKIYLQYACGKPRPAPDPDAVDLHEFELCRGLKPLYGEAAHLGRQPHPEIVLRTVRLGRDAFGMQLQDQLKAQVHADTREREKEKARQEKRRQKREQQKAERAAKSAPPRVVTVEDRMCQDVPSAPIPNGFLSAAPPPAPGSVEETVLRELLAELDAGLL
jgi:hypothetical protein